MRDAKQCDYCGEELDMPEQRYGREPVVCGATECVRWAHEEMRAIQEEAQDRAIEDGFSAYGGMGW